MTLTKRLMLFVVPIFLLLAAYLQLRKAAFAGLTSKIFPLRTMPANESFPYESKKIIVILAYGRTGSTLVGGLFQHYPGTFYVFEPIRSTVQGIYTDRNLKHNTSLIREACDKAVSQEIKQWLSCRLHQLSVKSLTDKFHVEFNTSLKQTSICIQKHPSNIVENNACINNAEHQCQEASILVFKFIRLRMYLLREMLTIFPNMKIIHLNRDPRGMFLSRAKVWEYSRGADFLRTECSKIAEDARAALYLLKNYPNRIKRILYEDMTEHPYETAKQMADFAGISVTDRMVSYIKNMTEAERNSGPYGTARKDPVATANAWRQSLKFDFAQTLYNFCNYSNMLYGYLPFATYEDMRNTSVPSRTKSVW